MKRSILVFLGLAVAGIFPLQAQVIDTVYQRREVIIIDEPQSETISRNSGSESDYRVEIVRHQRKNFNSSLSFFSRISLGYNGLVQDLSNMKLPEGAEWMDLENKSINFNLNLVKYSYSFIRHFGFETGLDLEVANFRFSRNMIPALNKPGDYVVEHPLDYHLKKSKLVNSYLNIPLILRVGFGNKDQLQIYGGMIGGWRWCSYVKEKSSQHGKDHHRGNLNLRNFHYGYTVGGDLYRTVGFFATYYPHSIFKTDKGPDVRQVNVGISLFY